MKKNSFLINVVLLISIIGVLGLTPSHYVGCKDIYPDEFLDLAMAWQYPILPVFAPHRNTHPSFLHFTKMVYLQRVDLLITCLRC
jgi:hypothetical protein